jgi:NagD protein
VPEQSIWTSALATARFLRDQRPGGSAYVIGEAGLTTALHNVGYTLSDRDPDYVILGETRTYSFERITKAIRLIVDGARFIATNPDTVGPTPDGPLPATGSVAALISRATGVEPYYVGKPNPLMMRSALNAIEAHSEHTAMIGDRMDTDIVAGLEAGLHTILVLTGVSTRETAERFPYRPSAIADSVADLTSELHRPGDSGLRESRSQGLTSSASSCAPCQRTSVAHTRAGTPTRHSARGARSRAKRGEDSANSRSSPASRSACTARPSPPPRAAARRSRGSAACRRTRAGIRGSRRRR